MKEWKWKGSRWWKFDFHTHTPASDDYGNGPDQTVLKKSKPRDWLLDYMRAGIDCVAITDHNSGAWVDLVKNELAQLERDRPEGFRPIHVFPGVEISVNGGIHLLAIFGCDKKTSDIDSLLGAVKLDGEKGLGGSITSLSFIDVVNKVTSAGGIAIPAHVDKEKGIFEKLDGATLKQLLDCKSIFAMELVDPQYKKPGVYTDRKPRWTEILGSDSHHPLDGSEQRCPGSRFTWVKMGTPGIEGLRLALLDGPLSVIRSDKEKDNPNEHAQIVLESIKVSKARYLGRSESFTIEFNPWLNSLIGGRGTGKSTIVEFLRIALRRIDELPDDFKKEFEKYQKIYRDRKEGGLLTDEVAIKIIYRKDDSRFRIQWNPEGNLEPIEQEIEGEWNPAKGDIRQRFPVRIYSQKQIFNLAKKPLALLRVVDEALEVDRDSWFEKWKQAERDFLSLRARARQMESGLSEESRLQGELEDVKRKQNIFEQAGYADVLRNYQRLNRQQRRVEMWEESWTDAGERLRQVARELIPDPLQDKTFNMDSEADFELCGYAAVVCEHLEKLRGEVESSASKADKILVEWKENKSGSSWKQGAAKAEEEYRKLKENLAREGENNPASYGELVQRRQDIENRLKELEESKEQVKQLEKQADVQLEKMMGIRRELTESRRVFLNEVLGENQYVRINVVPYGAFDAVEAEFRRLLQREGPGFEKDIGLPNGEGLLGKLCKGNKSSEEIEKNLKEIKNNVRDIASGKDNSQVKDQRFATHVSKLPPEAIDRVDVWFPEDSLDVQYNATGEGEKFLSIEEGSPGQKTTALLAFLLSYGEEPLILDQPEDDLDNLLIYDLIVTQLRNIKRRRQIIVVTHNANIVVNGDSELVTALAPYNGETKKDCNGSLQEKRVRETICAIMEGGSKAFEDRYRRIALEGEHI
ncbi:MAG: ABC transporter [Candidatus Dadabacteria bacterium]|nr:ABC transporter [Candidatus Dadabacteria bacterium]